MSGVITTASFIKDMKPLVKRWFGENYANYKPIWSQIFTVENSTDNYEEFATYAGLGLAQIKNEGASIAYDSMEQFYVVRAQHVVYNSGFMVTREMIEDGKAFKVAQRNTVELAKALNDAKEYRFANVLNRAFDTGYTWGDGKALCVVDHPTFGDNLVNAMSTPLDLSEAALEQAMIDIQKFQNNRGLKIMVQGKKLVVPKESQFEACRILKGRERPATADRDINALNYMGMLQGDPIIHQYMTDSDAFFVLTDVNEGPNGLRCLQKRAVEFGNDNVFDTEVAKFKASERYIEVVIDPRAIYGSQGA